MHLYASKWRSSKICFTKAHVVQRLHLQSTWAFCLIKMTIKYRGVYLNPNNSTFRAKIAENKKTINLGTFEKEEDAAAAYDAFILKNNLNRRLNFPDPMPESLIPNTKVIPLSKGLFAIVDEDRYAYLSQWTWSAHKSNNTFYAVRNLNKKKRAFVYMHRIIMNSTHLEVDHIDRNGLHNYRSNLRACTHRQNMINKSSIKNTSSKYRGVHWAKRASKWTAAIGKNGKPQYLGSFKDEIEAAICYDAKAKEYYGEFAYLNFPE